MGRWQQRYLVHGEGDALGHRVVLPLFEWYILQRLLEYDPETGELLHDRALIGIPKGNDKTEFCGRFAVCELCGPIAPLLSPRVILSAAGYDQSGELGTAARLSIVGDPEHDRPGPLAPYFRDGDHLLEDRILLPDGVGSIQRIAAVGGTHDGGKPTAHISDEVHELLTHTQRRVQVVQGKSLRKRRVLRRGGISGAIQVSITTAGADPDSLLGELYEHGKKVASGEIDDPGFLFLWWEASPDWNLDDPAELEQAILEANPAVGEFLPLANKIASFRDPTVPRHEFERYDLNLWPGDAARWIPDASWKACHSPLQLDKALPAYAAVRIGRERRTAAIAIAQRQAQQTVLRVRIWENPHAPNTTAWDEFRISPSDLEEHLRGLHREYDADVLTIERPDAGGSEVRKSLPGPEVTFWRAYFDRSAELLREEGMATLDIPQTEHRLAPGTQLFFQLIVDGQLAHDGSVDLSRHVRNTLGKPKDAGWRLLPQGDEQPIEGTVAAVLAVHRAHTAPPPGPRRSRKLVAWTPSWR